MHRGSVRIVHPENSRQKKVPRTVRLVKIAAQANILSYLELQAIWLVPTALVAPTPKTRLRRILLPASRVSWERTRRNLVSNWRVLARSAQPAHILSSWVQTLKTRVDGAGLELIHPSLGPLRI